MHNWNDMQGEDEERLETERKILKLRQEIVEDQRELVKLEAQKKNTCLLLVICLVIFVIAVLLMVFLAFL